MSNRDCYAVLGVSPTASEKEIRAAYRRLARRFHPDLHPGDEKATALLQRINAAYEILADPAMRRRYDELRAGAGRAPAQPQRRARTVGGAPGQPRPERARRWEVPLVGLSVEVSLGVSTLLDPTADERPRAQRPADEE